MKSYLLKLSIILFLIVPFVVGAVTIQNPLRYNNFGELVNAIIDFIFTIGLFITMIMMIVSGFHFITARGDPEKIKTARYVAIWAGIGLIVIISAKGLVAVIQSIFPTS